MAPLSFDMKSLCLRVNVSYSISPRPVLSLGLQGRRQSQPRRNKSPRSLSQVVNTADAEATRAVKCDKNTSARQVRLCHHHMQCDTCMVLNIKMLYHTHFLFCCHILRKQTNLKEFLPLVSLVNIFIIVLMAIEEQSLVQVISMS